MRIAALLLLLALAAGCASQAANEPPEPNVVEIVSVPPHASVSLDCGSGNGRQGNDADARRRPEVSRKSARWKSAPTTTARCA